MRTRELEYRDANGKRYVGFLAAPDSPSGPAVLVAHSACGVSQFEKGIAVRLAELGHVALCADYIGDGEVLAVSDVQTRLGHLFADSSLVRPAIEGALKALLSQPAADPKRIAATGYCFGGTAVLELARGGADIQAVVGFHAGLPVNNPQEVKNIRAKVMMHQGAADPFVPPDMRATFEKQMNEAGIDWQMVLHGGVLHAFTMKGSEENGIPGLGYNRAASERAWRSMLDLFAETIGKP